MYKPQWKRQKSVMENECCLYLFEEDMSLEFIHVPGLFSVLSWTKWSSLVFNFLSSHALNPQLLQRVVPLLLSSKFSTKTHTGLALVLNRPGTLPMVLDEDVIGLGKCIAPCREDKRKNPGLGYSVFFQELGGPSPWDWLIALAPNSENRKWRKSAPLTKRVSCPSCACFRNKYFTCLRWVKCPSLFSSGGNLTIGWATLSLRNLSTMACNVSIGFHHGWPESEASLDFTLSGIYHKLRHQTKP